MHSPRPGRPEDISDPALIWAMASISGAFFTGLGDNCADDYQVRGAELHVRGAGGNWWRMVRVEGGRYLMVGWERGVKTLCGEEPVFDLLADAPDWIPRSWAERVADNEWFGFAYWWDGERWDRTRYPDGISWDGIDPLLDPFLSVEAQVRDFVSHLELIRDDFWGDDEEGPAPDEEEFAEWARPIIERVAAGPVDPEWLEEAFSRMFPDFSMDEALGFLERAGLTKGASTPPEVPAGSTGGSTPGSTDGSAAGAPVAGNT